MGILDNIEARIKEIAQNTVNDLMYTSFQQVSNAPPTMGQVTSVGSDGLTLTVLANDGTTQTVTLVGGSPVGVGSYVAINNGLAFSS